MKSNEEVGGYPTYDAGMHDGYEQALADVIERSKTYFPVDPASQRLVSALVAKVKEEATL